MIWTEFCSVKLYVAHYWMSQKYQFSFYFIVDEKLKNCIRLKYTTLIELKWPDISAQYFPVYMYSICEHLIPPTPQKTKQQHNNTQTNKQHHMDNDNFCLMNIFGINSLYILIWK